MTEQPADAGSLRARLQAIEDAWMDLLAREIQVCGGIPRVAEQTFAERNALAEAIEQARAAADAIGAGPSQWSLEQDPPCVINAGADFSCVRLARGCTEHPRLGAALDAGGSPPPADRSSISESQGESVTPKGALEPLPEMDALDAEPAFSEEHVTALRREFDAWLAQRPPLPEAVRKLVQPWKSRADAGGAPWTCDAPSQGDAWATHIKHRDGRLITDLRKDFRHVVALVADANQNAGGARTALREVALEGAEAFFGEGRCSGHAQFNGRYCRDVAGPERWCINCAGLMLLREVRALASSSPETTIKP